MIARLIVSEHLTVQHCDADLVLSDGTQFNWLDSVEIGDGWIKLWVPVTEQHDQHIAPLLSTMSFTLRFTHNMAKEVVTRCVFNAPLRRRSIASCASRQVVCEELWFAAAGIDVPTEPSDVRFRRAVESEVTRALLQHFGRDKL